MIFPALFFYLFAGVCIAAAVMVAERRPQPRGLDEQLGADVVLEGAVSGSPYIADDRIGDVGVDVKRCRRSGPVARTFLAADRPPRKSGAQQAEVLGPLARAVKDRVAPAERVARGRSAQFDLRRA